MSLLWKQAMAWINGGHGDEHEAKAKPVKEAGFKGYVGREDWDEDEDGESTKHKFDEDLWDHTTPDPTHDEQKHYDKHDEYPDSHHERHEQAYGAALDKKARESEPDHIDHPLHDFVTDQGSNTSLWQNKAKLGPVDISKGVYATQSHVSQKIIDHHKEHGGTGPSMHETKYPSKPGQGTRDYLGDKHPLFVTHEGRLHAIEGHHRVAAALQDGKTHVEGWHYDGDKHGVKTRWEDDD